MVGGDWRKNYNMGGGIMKNKRNNESFLKEREGRYYRRFSRKEKELIAVFQGKQKIFRVEIEERT